MRLIIAIFMTTLIASGVMIAVQAQEPAPLSYANQIAALQKRLTESEVRIANFAQYTRQNTERIKDLERKVAGMQKQITILHAKKADR